MKADPELPLKFANVVLEELASIRSELVSQRTALIEILSRTTKERRRTIKDRLYDKRLHGPMDRAPALKARIGLRNFSHYDRLEIWQRQARWRSLVSDRPSSAVDVLCGYWVSGGKWVTFVSNYSPELHQLEGHGSCWFGDEIAKWDVHWTELPFPPL